jgi:2-methylcitrate dehydratase PrpD
VSDAPAAAQLATWGASLDAADLPAPVAHAAKRHLLDGVGLALAARRYGSATPSVSVAEGLGGPAEATPLGGAVQVSAPAAALADGALVHAIDFDDTHAGGLVHATAVVLPAALAVGEERGASGADVLTAAVLGYETVCRVAAATPHGFHARGLHATQVGGVFSSAATASRLMGLDADAMTHALGIAGSSAGGLLEFLTTGASTKQLHPGAASLSGVLAARLAAAGATGPATVLDGPHGVYAALSARPADLDVVTGELGERWETTRIGIKPYPSCQLMHATLDALRPLLAEIEAAGGVDAVREIVAYVHPDSAPTVCEPAERKVRPRTSYDAKFSLPWSVGALLVDRDVTVDTYDLDSVLRPAVGDVSARVRTVVTHLGDPALPAADAPGKVEVHLVDAAGATRTLTGEVPCSLGTSEHPLSDEQLLGKFLGNTLDTAPARELADLVMNLEKQADLSAVIDAAARAAAASTGE